VVLDRGRLVAIGRPADVLTPMLLGSVFGVAEAVCDPDALAVVLPQAHVMARRWQARPAAG
jgi:ABC-type cobalamin/Fe3+-siderophores transport system ATPase subunit